MIGIVQGKEWNVNVDDKKQSSVQKEGKTVRKSNH